jgi:hypothetical protein
MPGGRRIDGRTLRYDSKSFNKSPIIPYKRKNGRPTRDSPWCDHLDIGLESVEGELEADLVVSFPRTAMRHEAEGEEVGLRMAEKGYTVQLTRSPPSLRRQSSRER